MDKWSLISESVAVTQIDIHPTGEELDRHVVLMTPGVSSTTTIDNVPTKSKSRLCSQDEVLAPSNAQPGRHSRLPHSASNKLPRSREGWFNKVVTRLLGLPSPIKIWYVANTNQGMPLGLKRSVLNQDRLGLPHRNLGIATSLSPLFPSECSTDPLLAPPGIAIVTNMTSTHHIQDILLVHENRGSICEWDLPLDFYRGYQLRIPHLVVKVIQLHKDSIRKGTTMQPITIIQEYPIRNAQYIKGNKTSHASSIGAICTGACLA
jgi:hypothetical protein